MRRLSARASATAPQSLADASTTALASAPLLRFPCDASDTLPRASVKPLRTRLQLKTYPTDSALLPCATHGILGKNHTTVTLVLMNVLYKLVTNFYSYSLIKRRRRPQKPQRLARNCRGALAHGTPLSGAGKGDGKGAGKGNGKARALPPAFAADRLHATDGSGVFGHIPTAASGERRYDSNGAGPFTREQFHQYYNGSLREWDVATPEHFGVYAAPPRAPPTTRLTHPPSRLTPSAQADSTAEPNAKSPRMHTRPPHSPGHSLANTAANFALQEHGSHFPDAPMAQAAPNIPIIHGWNCPMPPPGTVPIGKRITLPHLPAAAKLLLIQSP